MTMGRLDLRRFRRPADDSGSAAVELALIALPIIVLALGTFDYFAAGYEITALEGAARAIAEYARDASVCGTSGFVIASGSTTGSANSACSSGMSSLWSTMQTNNNSLSGAAFTTSTYYTCTGNTAPQNGSCSAPCGGCSDTREWQYVAVTVTQSSWWKLFSWDPWSSLTATVNTRIQ